MKKIIPSFLFISFFHTLCPTALPIGQTHFVIDKHGNRYKKPGMRSLPSMPPRGHAPITRGATPKKTGTYVFFSPDDDIRQLLLGMINKEQRAIKMAMFNFTEPKIADALIDAHKRGVSIEIVVDPSCLRSHKNKVGLLARMGIAVFVFNGESAPRKTGWGTCMHHKFMVFSDNALHRPCVWTGSFNLTRSARTNQENVIILEDKHVVKRFEDQFVKLKNRCQKHQYSKKI